MVRNMNTVITPNIILAIRTLLIFSVFFSAALQAANITVSTSRNPVSLDDSFHLIYEADSNVDDDPDFSPIYQYFDILNSSQSTNMRSINGSWSMKKTWDLSVIAKDVGTFTIPPIAFGSDISPAIQVTVTNSSSPNSVSPNGQASIPAKIFLESSLDKKTGWVQAQFIYTVRLLRTVSIASASMTEPETSDPDAIIEKLSEDNYTTTRNGISYEVFERRYAIFPQKSGQLKINPVTFEGRVNATQPRTIFDQFRMSGQLKRLRSKAVSATVKAAPSTIKLQDWLPASKLQLVEEWSDDISNIKTGDPVTRTITIAAHGLTAVQLPELKIEDIDGLKQYPDKPVTENRTQANGITGLKQIKIAIIPTRAGSYTLPAIKLQWWNTKTNKKEFATIPEQVLTAIGSASTSGNIAPVQPVQTQTLPNTPPAVADNSSIPAPLPAGNSAYWQWSTLAFALAWLVTLFLLFRKPGVSKADKSIRPEVSFTPLKAAIAAVEKQAKNNNAENTRAALIEWAKAAYADNTITNLSQISERCSPQLAEEIRRLNASLYSPEKPSWNGKPLLIAFKAEQSLNKPPSGKTDSALKPLYGR